MTKNAGRCQLRQGWTGFTAGAVLVLACAGCTVSDLIPSSGKSDVSAAAGAYLEARAKAYEDLAANPPATCTAMLERINSTGTAARADWDEAMRKHLEANFPPGEHDELPADAAAKLRAIARGYRGAK